MQAQGGAFHGPYLWAVGVGMLMPTGVSFSYWAFFWLLKLQHLLVVVVGGWGVSPEAPYPFAQSAGALLVVGLYALWSGRKHLARAATHCLRPVPGFDEREPMRYRRAFFLLVLSLAFLIFFAWRAGAPLWFLPLVIMPYLIATLALSRVRAELGAPANEVHNASVHQLLTRIANPGALPARGLVALTLLGWTNNSYGVDPTPLQAEGFQMTHRARLSNRRLAGVMLLALVAGIAVNGVVLLDQLYRLGADSSKLHFVVVDSPVMFFTELESWLSGMPAVRGYHGFAMGGAWLVTVLLYALRARFPRWPLHPIGYVMAPMWFTHHLMVSVFLSWLIKSLLLRYGGLRAYQRSLPFFLGLILGDCVAGSLWTILDVFVPVPVSCWIY